MWVGTVAGWLDSIKTCDRAGLARLSDHTRLGKQARQPENPHAIGSRPLLPTHCSVFGVSDVLGMSLRHKDARALVSAEQTPCRDDTVAASRARSRSRK